MRYLLDTHLLIWIFEKNEKLPGQIPELLCNRQNKFLYSAASTWEVAVKHSKHPDLLPTSAMEFEEYCKLAGYQHLSITPHHALTLETLKQKEGAPSHGDPFDRMLLAQAKAEGMVLLTHDKAFASYDEPNVFIV